MKTNPPSPAPACPAVTAEEYGATPVVDVVLQNLGRLAARWKTGAISAQEFTSLAQDGFKPLKLIERELAAREAKDAAIAAVLEDKARMDWILGKATAPDWARDWPACYKLEVWLNVSNHDGLQPSIREAIDAAMEREKSATTATGTAEGREKQP